MSVDAPVVVRSSSTASTRDLGANENVRSSGAMGLLPAFSTESAIWNKLPTGTSSNVDLIRDRVPCWVGRSDVRLTSRTTTCCGRARFSTSPMAPPATVIAHVIHPGAGSLTIHVRNASHVMGIRFGSRVARDTRSVVLEWSAYLRRALTARNSLRSRMLAVPGFAIANQRSFVVHVLALPASGTSWSPQLFRRRSIQSAGIRCCTNVKSIAVMRPVGRLISQYMS